MPETQSLQLPDIASGLEKIKANTLYLQLQERHKEALNCLDHILQLDVQVDNLRSYKLKLRYEKITEELCKLNLQILLTRI